MFNNPTDEAVSEREREGQRERGIATETKIAI